MELLLHQWGDWPELYRNTDKTEATEIVIIDSQMNYRGKLDTYTRFRRCRNLLTTACIHDTVDVSIENDEEKSSQAENGRASPEGGSGYG